MSSILQNGVIAALLAPFFMALGFIIWDVIWNKSGGSAFALNLFKCNLAALGFLTIFAFREWTSTDIRFQERFTLYSVMFLVMSGVLGIVIGDLAWLEALRQLGATQVLFIDSIKPFAGAVIGWLFLDESIGTTTVIGMTLTIIGIVNVSLEKENKQDFNKEINTHTPEPVEYTDSDKSVEDTQEKGTKHYQGYSYAIANVLLDTCGSFLTKKYGWEMNTWEINLIRFGSSGAILAFISIIMSLLIRRETNVHQISSVQSSDKIRPWYWLPYMNWKDWMKISFGVLFVTFLTPALSNYALFKITLALAFTLGSITPLYALILDWILTGKKPSKRSVMSAFLAAGGVALLSSR